MVISPMDHGHDQPIMGNQ